MNLPNRLTVLRMLLIPMFLVLFFWQAPGHYLWALLVFAAASLTDMLDGKIARKRGLITDFGKLMDPLADKLLVMSALICLLQGEVLPLICLILILSREFLVTSMRLLAAGKGQVLAADIWGKLKTVFQMVYICVALFGRAIAPYAMKSGMLGGWRGAAQAAAPAVFLLEALLFWLMLAMTVLSGAHYCLKNRGLFADA